MKELQLIGKHGNGKVVLVDDDIFDKVNHYKWNLSNRFHGGYARTKINGKHVYLHRFITNAPAGMTVDHIDRNTMNNQSSNLRICSMKENNFNKRKPKNSSSQFVGVNKRDYVIKKPWRATISINGKSKCLGYFETEEEAAKTYDLFAKQIKGPLATLNFA